MAKTGILFLRAAESESTHNKARLCRTRLWRCALHFVTLDFWAERPANFFIAACELPSLNEILCCHWNLVTRKAGDLGNCPAAEIHNRSHAYFAVIAEEDHYGKAAHRNGATSRGSLHFFLRRLDRN